MLKVLVNAYACRPGMGSEQGMAWNWCAHLAKHCELHIITEEEYREKIEVELQNAIERGRGEYLERAQAERMHFYWNRIGHNEQEASKIRRMCWNQGDWRFYHYYRRWQWRTYEMAREIVARKHINILHQLNMIGFREPGYLWKIEGMPFVWGPIGGLKQFPTAYLSRAGWKMKMFVRLKNLINTTQLRFSSRVNKALRRADLLISSIPDSYYALKKHKGLESIIIPETGCALDITRYGNKKHRFEYPYLRIIWVGKFDFRKRLDIALYALAKTANPHLHLQVFGTGSDKQVATYKAMANELGLDEMVEFMGNRKNTDVLKAMDESDVFLFTSISEDTSTVVLESVSRMLPVVCFDACGMAAVIDSTCGIKIPLTTPTQSAEDFAAAINRLYKDRALLKSLSEGCRQRAKELSWDRKAEQVAALYKQLINK